MFSAQSLKCRTLTRYASSTSPQISIVSARNRPCSGPFATARHRRACASATINHSDPPGAAHSASRSEEHTSELKSLMRHSYAVFCLKTNNIHKISTDTHSELTDLMHKMN